MTTNDMANFTEAKTQAEMRRQQAMAEAKRVFDSAREDMKRAGAERYHRASAMWDIFKAAPTAEGHDAAREEFRLASTTAADFSSATSALDQAVRAAERAYRRELVEAGETHGVSIGLTEAS
jgi:hypothetical protein